MDCADALVPYPFFFGGAFRVAGGFAPVDVSGVDRM